MNLIPTPKRVLLITPPTPFPPFPAGGRETLYYRWPRFGHEPSSPQHANVDGIESFLDETLHGPPCPRVRAAVPRGEREEDESLVQLGRLHMRHFCISHREKSEGEGG